MSVGVCLNALALQLWELPAPGLAAAERAVGNCLLLAALPPHVLHRT